MLASLALCGLLAIDFAKLHAGWFAYRTSGREMRESYAKDAKKDQKKECTINSNSSRQN
jgi:hypothetical protein